MDREYAAWLADVEVFAQKMRERLTAQGLSDEQISLLIREQYSRMAHGDFGSCVIDDALGSWEEAGGGYSQQYPLRR
jgi:hypothetical protein